MISKYDLFICEGGENAVDAVGSMLNELMEEIKNYQDYVGVGEIKTIVPGYETIMFPKDEDHD